MPDQNFKNQETPAIPKKRNFFRKFLLFLGISLGVLALGWTLLFYLLLLYVKFFGPIRSEAALVEIERFAGCYPRAMMETISDEEFSKYWTEISRIYSFTYDDVTTLMEQRCPIRTDEEIETNYRYLLIDVNENKREEGLVWIEKEKKCEITSKSFSTKNSPFLKTNDLRLA